MEFVLIEFVESFGQTVYSAFIVSKLHLYFYVELMIVNFYISGLLLIFLVQQFWSTIVTGVVEFIYRKFQKADFMLNLKTILIKKHGWTESEVKSMFDEKKTQLNRLKIKQKFDTEKMAKYIDEHYSGNFKTAFD